MKHLKRPIVAGALTLGLYTTLCTITFGQQSPPATGSEADLIAVLESDSASLFDKAKACQQLAVIGTDKSVPVLAELLSNEQLSHYARFGLEPIPSGQVDVALRNALNELEGGLLAGVINSIGMRRDAESVGQLQRLMRSDDSEVAECAVASLGRIGTPEAIAALRESLAASGKLRDAAALSLLTAAKGLLTNQKLEEAVAIYDALRQAELPGHLTGAALAGAIRARGDNAMPLLVDCLKSNDRAKFRVGLRVAHELGGSTVAQALMDQLKLPTSDDAAPGNLKAQHPREVLLIYTLGDLRQKVALPVVLQAAQNDALDIKRAAIDVLAALGDASAIPVLMENAVDGSDGLDETARNSLAELPGDDVDAALADKLDEVQGGQLGVVIDLVGRRGISSAVPDLLRLANDKNEQVRRAAVEALGLTVGLDQLSTLIDRLVAPPNEGDAETAKDALRRAVLRMPDRDATAGKLLDAMSQASPSGQVDLLDLLGVVGGTKALAGVANAAKTGGANMEDAATRVLGEWMSPDAAPVLLDLASRLRNERFQARALRGYLRIARQLDVPTEQRIAMCRRALRVAKQDTEKKRAFDVLARYPSAESLAIVAPYLDVPSLEQAAAEVAIVIAEKAQDAKPADVAAAMKKAIEATRNAELRKRGQEQLKKAEAKKR